MTPAAIAAAEAYGPSAPDELSFDSGGASRFPSRRRRADGILLLHYQPHPGRRGAAATISEHVAAFGRHSRFPVWEVNTDLPPPRGLLEYDPAAIVLHYSLFVPTWYRLDDGYRELLQRSSGYKVAFFQDEMRHCADRFWFLDEFGIDCVYTLLEPPQFDAVYGSRTRVETIRTNLPGYVEESLPRVAARLGVPDPERPVDVGYRARPLPPWMGRGALEKTEIGRRFAVDAAGRGLTLDIALGEDDRLYGDDWYRFVASCRGMLGVESGVSAFDLDDRARHQYESLVAERGSEQGITIEELEAGPLGEIDGNVFYRTISPRHFEAAAFGVTQILFEGRYSGAMEAGTHYIPLRKDFSNLDEAIARFRDPGERSRIASAARRDLIESGEYSYASFIAGFDRTLIDAGLRPEASTEMARSVHRAVTRGRRIRSLRAGAARRVEEVRRKLAALVYAVASRRRRR